MNNLESCLAQHNIDQNICEYSGQVVLQLNNEQDLIRDNYKSIVETKGSKITLSAMKITPNPSIRQMEKIGIFEAVDVVFTFAVATFENAGLKFKDIDLIRYKLMWENETYQIKDKLRKGDILGDFMYIVLTGVKQ